MTGDAAPGAVVLLVEDDAPTRREVATHLQMHGLRVRQAADAGEALASWEAGRPDLVLLDLGLPDVDGTAIIRKIRREATTPIVVLSARDREEARVAALDQGADDFVTKPFSSAELLARLRAVLRRAAGPTADATGQLRLGALAIDVARHTVDVDGVPVALTAREFEVLKVLVSHAGRLVTHGRLLRAVWGTAYADEAHYVHVYVSRIRRKLEAADPDGRLRDIIVAEPGVGYRVRLPAS